VSNVILTRKIIYRLCLFAMIPPFRNLFMIDCFKDHPASVEFVYDALDSRTLKVIWLRLSHTCLLKPILNTGLGVRISLPAKEACRTVGAPASPYPSVVPIPRAQKCDNSSHTKLIILCLSDGCQLFFNFVSTLIHASALSISRALFP
jgi:hypothetical protein